MNSFVEFLRLVQAFKSGDGKKADIDKRRLLSTSLLNLYNSSDNLCSFLCGQFWFCRKT